LPLDFWALDLLAAIALLIGVGVLAFKPNDVAHGCSLSLVSG
jgi:hypothetical protein